jgi:hypothetical protein
MSMNASFVSQPPGSSPEQQPMIIPIHTPPSSQDDDIPEWAMLELNGELLMPQESAGKENPSKNGDDGNGGSKSNCTSLIPPHHVELGAIEFVDNVREFSLAFTEEFLTCFRHPSFMSCAEKIKRSIMLYSLPISVIFVSIFRSIPS